MIWTVRYPLASQFGQVVIDPTLLIFPIFAISPQVSASFSLKNLFDLHKDGLKFQIFICKTLQYLLYSLLNLPLDKIQLFQGFALTMKPLSFTECHFFLQSSKLFWAGKNSLLA